jgi:hypothetical protein
VVLSSIGFHFYPMCHGHDVAVEIVPFIVQCALHIFEIV